MEKAGSFPLTWLVKKVGKQTTVKGGQDGFGRSRAKAVKDSGGRKYPQQISFLAPGGRSKRQRAYQIEKKSAVKKSRQGRGLKTIDFNEYSGGI